MTDMLLWTRIKSFFIWLRAAFYAEEWYSNFEEESERNKPFNYVKATKKELELMTKKQLESYGASQGIILNRKHSKKRMISELL